MRGTDIVLRRKYLIARYSGVDSIQRGAYPAVCKEKDPKGQAHLFEGEDGAVFKVSSRLVIRRWVADDDAVWAEHQDDLAMRSYTLKIKQDVREREQTAAKARGERALALLELAGVTYKPGLSPRVVGDGQNSFEAWLELSAQSVIDLCEASVLLRRRALS